MFYYRLIFVHIQQMSAERQGQLIGELAALYNFKFKHKLEFKENRVNVFYQFFL